MRRTLTALLALLLAAAGLLAAGAGYLAGTEDDVELTHHLIAGDPAAAQGITLTLPAGDQQGQTCWETTVALGTEMLSPETAFTFYPGGKDWEGSIQPGAEIYTGSFSYGISASGSIDFADYLGEEEEPPRRHDATLMVLPAVDVAERTEDGETRTETLRLADYYDYFPITVELTLPEGDGRCDRLYTTWAESRALTEYFGLTVPEDLMVEVSATRDAYGNVTQVDCRGSGPTSRPWWWRAVCAWPTPWGPTTSGRRRRRRASGTLASTFSPSPRSCRTATSWGTGSSTWSASGCSAPSAGGATPCCWTGGRRASCSSLPGRTAP